MTLMLILTYDDSLRARSVREEGSELVILARSHRLLLGSSLIGSLLAACVLSSGCGSDGAGTIHIDSSKSRRQNMQTGAGLVPTPAAKLSPSGMPRKTVPRPRIKTPVPKHG
jgi:hypothetical protein